MHKKDVNVLDHNVSKITVNVFRKVKGAARNVIVSIAKIRADDLFVLILSYILFMN